MNHGMPQNSMFAAHLIAAEEQHEAMRKAARQAHLIKESELAFGKISDGRSAMVRQGLGIALIRAGERLKGVSAVAAKTSVLPTNS
jgi:hypothetical protein